MGAGPFQTRHSGWAMRIYRDSGDKILGFDCIDVTEDKTRVSLERFHRSAKWDHVRTLVHAGSSSRVIDRITMLGDYSSIEQINGNFLNASYAHIGKPSRLMTSKIEPWCFDDSPMTVRIT